jgi:NADH-quinone oxidoreductase subunit J
MEYILILISSLLLACSTLVIGSQNPIHSILFLILVFFNGSLILFFLQVEFFAIIFLVIYIGAIIVLFLFMVMMLKIKHINSAQKFMDFFPYGGVIALFLLLIILLITKNMSLPVINNFWSLNILNIDNIITKIFTFQVNIENLGKVLYTAYISSFLEIGFVLLISMVGAIVITLETDLDKQKLVKKQELIDQGVQENHNMIFFSMKS